MTQKSSNAMAMPQSSPSEALRKAALTFAGHGWYVFPIVPGNKYPPIVKWSVEATTDPEQINRWWDENPNANIGIATGPSGLSVIDLDVKKDKPGIENFRVLCQQNGNVPPTMTFQTPTGGQHLVYKGTGLKSTYEKLGKGIDTRCEGGYIVAPGSIVPEGIYRVIQRGEPAPIPQWLAGLIGRRETGSVEPIENFEPDSELAIDEAIRFLGDREPAIEGAGGDNWTFQTALKLRDLGISEATAYRLMSRLWNETCEPPWEEADLKAKVVSAFKSATGAPGSALASNLFQGVPTDSKKLEGFRGSSIRPHELERREWILPSRLIAGFVSVTIAPGGTGKSMLSMLEAVSVATGLNLSGYHPVVKTPVLIYNTEDPLDELQRRLLGIAIHNNIPLEQLRDVHLVSGVDDPLILVREERGNNIVTGHGDRLLEYVNDNRIRVICVDPFIRSHRVNENDNSAIDAVTSVFSQLATKTRAAVNLVHHTRKGTPSPGDMDLARGASSLVSAARIASTISTMSEREAERLQLEDERHWYIRRDSAKSNMQPPAAEAEWFKKMNVLLPNGDRVGVVEPVDLSERDFASAEYKQVTSRALAAHVLPNFGLGEWSLHSVTQRMREAFPEKYSAESASTTRRRIEDAFEVPLDFQGYRLSISTRLQGTRTVKTLLVGKFNPFSF